MVADWREVGPLAAAGTVTLDASGNGQIPFDVYSANHRWVIKGIVASTNQASTQTPYPTVTVYLGAVQQGQSSGASWTGNQETFAGNIDMGCADTLFVNFTGGVAGSIATARISGTNYLWR
jgi:hypothetical protein